MDQGWGHPLQAKATRDLVSGDQALWAGHIVWAVALLTALGDALSSLLTGFACEDGGTGRRRLQGKGPRAGGHQGSFPSGRQHSFPTLIFSRGESCHMWSLVSPSSLPGSGCPSQAVDTPPGMGRQLSTPLNLWLQSPSTSRSRRVEFRRIFKRESDFHRRSSPDVLRAGNTSGGHPASVRGETYAQHRA